jgi:hypothetical protein
MVHQGKRNYLNSPSRPRQNKITSFGSGGRKRLNNQESPKARARNSNSFQALAEDEEVLFMDSEVQDSANTLDDMVIDFPLANSTPNRNQMDSDSYTLTNGETQGSPDSTATKKIDKAKLWNDTSTVANYDTLDTSSLVDFPALPKLSTTTENPFPTTVELTITSTTQNAPVINVPPEPSEMNDDIAVSNRTLANTTTASNSSHKDSSYDPSSLKPPFNSMIHRKIAGTPLNSLATPVTPAPNKNTTPTGILHASTQYQSFQQNRLCQNNGFKNSLTATASIRNPWAKRTSHSCPNVVDTSVNPLALDQRILFKKRGQQTSHTLL